MTFARTAVVAAAAVAATVVSADGITMSMACAQDCTGCTDATTDFTSGTMVCTAGASSATMASSMMCESAANTCVGMTSYSDDACATATSYSAVVCGVCAAVASTTSLKVVCSKGSTDISYMVYSAANDCTGDAVTISMSGSCTAPLGSYGKVTKSGFGCNIYAIQTHATNECSSDVSFKSYAVQNECMGSLVTDATLMKVSCPGNDDASSASVFSAAAAAVVAILCVVA